MQSHILPEMGSPKGVLDIYEIGSERLLRPEERIMDFMSPIRNSYQSREELCYIMTTKTSKATKEDKSETETSFTTQMCNRLGSWWTICKFKRKISVSLSGLCDASPVDRRSSLLEPVKDSHDRYGTLIGTTGWILDFDKHEQKWKIHHKIFEQIILKMLDPSRRPFGRKLWEAGHYVCEQ